MRSARTRPEAEDELGFAAVYYERRRPGLGVEFVVAVEDAIMKIVERPRAYPRWRSDRPYHRFVLRRFPYSVFYTYSTDEDRVDIVAIAHNKRRPGYWASRDVDG